MFAADIFVNSGGWGNLRDNSNMTHAVSMRDESAPLCYIVAYNNFKHRGSNIQ